MGPCKNPFVKEGTAYGCGQCLPCRIQKRREWTHRLMLEAVCHTNSFFLTLTYSDQFIPRLTGRNTGESLSTLRPKDLQDWLKRLRVAIAPLRMRFYAVGEYGEQGRPHYHVAVFGMSGCMRVKTLEHPSTGEPLWQECCPRCRFIGKTWGKGHVHLGWLGPESASYIAKYVVKKMTRPDDIRLFGRHPEFSRQSNRPGIGADALWEVANTMLHYDVHEQMVDVPTTLNVGRKHMPLGRYLRRKLRTYVGKEADTPAEVIAAMAEEMRPVREAAFEASESLKKAVVESNAQTIANIEAKYEIFKQRNRL